MIDDIYRMEKELGELNEYRNNFYSIDKKYGILEEKMKTYKIMEIVYNISISMGALLVGLAKPLWDIGLYGILALTGGALLWVLGSIMKVGRMFIK